MFEPNDGHKHDFSRLLQHTILDKTEKPEHRIEIVDGVRKKVKYVPRILAFEKYCALCGLVEEALPIGVIVNGEQA